jgi:hypothetical protein
LVTTGDGGGLLRIIAGELGDQAGPGSTHTPITLVHATVHPRAQLRLPWARERNALVYNLGGRATVGAGRQALREGQLAVLAAGDTLTVGAEVDQDARHARRGRTAAARRAADQRAGGDVRAVRDEHPLRNSSRPSPLTRRACWALFPPTICRTEQSRALDPAGNSASSRFATEPGQTVPRVSAIITAAEST